MNKAGAMKPDDIPALHSCDDVRAAMDESMSMNKELKRCGWKFIGLTTCCAFMQSIGMVNDHAADCDDYIRTERLDRNFTRPTANGVYPFEIKNDMWVTDRASARVDAAATTVVTNATLETYASSYRTFTT